MYNSQTKMKSNVADKRRSKQMLGNLFKIYTNTKLRFPLWNTKKIREIFIY